MNNRGFTLVEILATIVILFIIVTAFYQYFITSQRESVISEEKLEALNVAQGVFEKIEHGMCRENINMETVKWQVLSSCQDLNEYTGYTINIKLIRRKDVDLYRLEVLVHDNHNTERRRSSVKGLVDL